MTQQLAQSSECEVERITANEVLKSCLLTLWEWFSALLGSRDEALFRTDSLLAELTICQAQLQDTLAKQEKTQLAMSQLKKEPGTEQRLQALEERDRALS